MPITIAVIIIITIPIGCLGKQGILDRFSLALELGHFVVGYQGRWGWGGAAIRCSSCPLIRSVVFVPRRLCPVVAVSWPLHPAIKIGAHVRIGLVVVVDVPVGGMGIAVTMTIAVFAMFLLLVMLLAFFPTVLVVLLVLVAPLMLVVAPVTTTVARLVTPIAIPANGCGLVVRQKKYNCA